MDQEANLDRHIGHATRRACGLEVDGDKMYISDQARCVHLVSRMLAVWHLI